jgi:predicted dienelactone hydrolase
LTDVARVLATRPMVGALVITLAAGLLIADTAHALPDVTKPGRFAVGVTSMVFTKSSETTGAPRPLDTSIWYPAVLGTGAETDMGRRDATVRPGHHPLILFSHGMCSIPNQSVFLMTALASFGFVVASPPHPGNQYTDGFPACELDAPDSYRNRVADVRFVLDAMLAESKRSGSRFFRHVNPRRIGMSGHSFGGQTTLRVALVEPRVRAALALAPALVGGIEPGTIHIPAMIQGAEVDSLATFRQSTLAFAHLAGPRFLLEILRAGHFAFTDICASFLYPGPDCGPGTLTQDEAHAQVLRFGVPFFLRYLAGDRRFARLLRPASAPAGVVLQTTPER